MRHRRLATGLGLVTGVVAVAMQAAATPAGADSATPGWEHPAANAEHACAAPTRGHMACLALRRTDVTGHRGLSATLPQGYGPADIQSAYDIPGAGGAGVTVAIVSAYDDPNAESDLATYRSEYGLPACTTDNGCFRKVDQRGGSALPSGDTGWAAEDSVSLDAVSAACPACHILLVEADESSYIDLYEAVDEAYSLGARFISNSYSSGEYASETDTDFSFDRPDAVIAFANGGNGYSSGTWYPASSRYVVAVGGTTLTRADNSRGWSESAWSGAGSGCSLFEPQPSWQAGVGTGCSRRATSDISADADPLTGLAVYDTYGQSGWAEYGGTGLATPLVTAMWAIAGTPDGDGYAASYPYRNASDMYDVTSGSNGSCGGAPVCTAGPGWDGPTGMGTPVGLTALEPGGGTTGTVDNPGGRPGTVPWPHRSAGLAPPFTGSRSIR